MSASASTRLRVGLLASQALALGLTVAWVVVSATSIFLETYGSELLPATYIGAAFAGVASSIALNAAVRRSPLVDVATRVLGGFSVLLIVAWLALWRAEADWVAFALVVLVPIMVPVGFVFVVGQAGSLLDVRTLKLRYSRVIAGFASGFVLGGLAGPILLDVLGGTEHLVAAAATSSAALGLLVVVTRRLFAAELRMVDDVLEAEPRPTLRVLLRHRYVALIIAFQMLSALESQWLDFLLFDRAAQRYADSEDLARFVSRFTAVTFGIDIVVLLVLAGPLLRRFGLRYGLTANPVAVLTLIAAILVAGSVRGAGATLVFALVVVTRTTDFVFADAAARTSLSAAYQAVPTNLRLAAQATVEGLGVPLAIGVSGIGLLLLQLVGGTNGAALPVLTGAVVCVWAAVALATYRGYRQNLLAALRRRQLDPAELAFDEVNSMPVIERLVASDHPADVRLALDTMAGSGHPTYVSHLERLCDDGRAEVRAEAIQRLADVAPATAHRAATAGLGDESSIVRAASALSLDPMAIDAEAIEVLTRAAHDSDLDVRVAALTARARMADASVRASAAHELAELAISPTTDDRIVAARVLGTAESADRGLLGPLVSDAESSVAGAALESFRWPADAAIIDQVVARLADRATSGRAADALVRAGEEVFQHVESGLNDLSADRTTQVSWIRVARRVGGARATAVLLGQIGHADREVGLAALSSLARIHTSAPASRDLLDASSGALASDLGQARGLLRACCAVAHLPAVTLLVAAIEDELDVLRRRILMALAIRYGEANLDRVARQLDHDDSRGHALAIEWLDVTLSGSDREAIAVLIPGLSHAERLRALRDDTSPIEATALLLTLVTDPEASFGQPWIRACALLALADHSDHIRSLDGAQLAPHPAVRPVDHLIVDETLLALCSRL